MKSARYPRDRLRSDHGTDLTRYVVYGLVLLLLAACVDGIYSPTVVKTPLAKELVLYNWPDYIPESVLNAFQKEYGTRVIIHTYDSQDEAYKNITNGTTSYDLAVLDYDLLPSLIDDNLLAEIDFSHIPNFENISPDFRDLVSDPGNRHSVPYNWGTSGLIVRGDLVEKPITKWADLWDRGYAGKIAIHNEPTEIISIALRSLGYPLNSENPVQLEQALTHLLEIRKSVVFISSDPQVLRDILKSGEIAIVQGWNGDALLAQEEFPAIQYVLPEEGTMLWVDTFVISAKSPNQYTAEAFLNFVLRPEVSAQIVTTYRYPSANEAAKKFLDPAILNNPFIYPTHAVLISNSFYTPLGEKGQKLYKDIWNRFLDGGH
jgi:spermidine/putrescine transport system substrate-binding protein